MFKRMIRGIIDWAMKDRYANEQEPARPPRRNLATLSINSTSKAPSAYEIENINGLNFTVFSAIGGKVIQTSYYDPNTDKSRSTLYVITDKEELGDEIAQIITRENLTR